ADHPARARTQSGESCRPRIRRGAGDHGARRVLPRAQRAHHGSSPRSGLKEVAMAYSSKDFGKTEPTLRVELPEKLVHRHVERASRDEAFSRERKHPVFVVDLPSRVLSMTIG